MQNYSDYFNYRNIDAGFYSDYKIPKYLLKELPDNKEAKILDIGCGFGMTLSALADLGYRNIKGIDISETAVNYCVDKGIDVEYADIHQYCNTSKTKFDFIIMSHVLEHIEKSETISTLKNIRTLLLDEAGSLCIMVPNAQSNTGSYWAYEDFTHHTLFTTGSIIYVLKAAGFNSIKFLDPKGIENSSFAKKIFKELFLSIYIFKKKFWNKITSSAYHQPSPHIFTYELKVLAGN
jgi:predicted TPR repeat methyltransferase